MCHPARVYVFDRVDASDPVDVRSMNRRVAACYAWAAERDIKVLDEMIAWTDGRSAQADVLSEAAEACRRNLAGLLVHSPATLTGLGGLTPEVLASLTPLPVLTVVAAGAVAYETCR